MLIVIHTISGKTSSYNIACITWNSGQ